MSHTALGPVGRISDLFDDVQPALVLEVNVLKHVLWPGSQAVLSQSYAGGLVALC